MMNVVGGNSSYSAFGSESSVSEVGTVPVPVRSLRA